LADKDTFRQGDGKVGFIDWSNIKNTELLVSSLERFLINVFGKEFVTREYSKLKSYIPKGKPEELRYLIVPNVHRVAKWYKLLQTIKERGYSFNLRFSTDVEEFMRLLLFSYALDTLVRYGGLSLDRREITGALRNKDRFESLMYEVMIASNYVSNGFDTEFPELFGGRVDVYAKKGGIKVYAECKTLKRNDKYVDIAVEVGSLLNEEKVNVLLDIMLSRTPKKGNVKKVSNIVRRAVEEGRELEEEGIKVSLRELPEYIRGPFQVHISNPENVEYVLSSSYVKFSAGGLEVKEPKIIILRNPNKYEEVSKRLESKLKDAYRQLKTARGGRKVIYVDASEVVGRFVFQLPELISLATGPELLFSRLEAFVRSWLERYAEVDAVVITEPKLYVDPFGIPYAIALECKAISSYIVPGRTIEMLVIPMPKNASPGLLVNMGIELARRGYYSLALAYYRRAIEIKPDLKEAYNNLGKLLTEIGRSDEALKYLDKALGLDPNYTSALINKGVALAELGRYSEALGIFDKAINLEPNNEKAWYNKALVYYILGKFKEAHECVTKALRINSNYKDALKLRNLLKNVYNGKCKSHENMSNFFKKKQERYSLKPRK